MVEAHLPSSVGHIQQLIDIEREGNTRHIDEHVVGTERDLAVADQPFRHLHFQLVDIKPLPGEVIVVDDARLIFLESLIHREFKARRVFLLRVVVGDFICCEHPPFDILMRERIHRDGANPILPSVDPRMHLHLRVLILVDIGILVTFDESRNSHLRLHRECGKCVVIPLYIASVGRLIEVCRRFKCEIER